MNTTTLPQAAPDARPVAPPQLRNATTEPTWVKWSLIGVALTWITLGGDPHKHLVAEAHR